MATVLEVRSANASADAFTAEVNVGATNPNGQLIYRTAGDVEVATNDFSATAYAAAVAGVATANAIADDTSATGGVTTKFTIEDRDNAKLATGSVTATSGGGDIELAGGTTIGAGATVSTTALTHTQPLS